jgi:hypothetical protein
MRELIINKILTHWDDSFIELFDITIEDLYNLSDKELFDFYNTIFEI